MCQTHSTQLLLASINTLDDGRWEASCKKLLQMRLVVVFNTLVLQRESPNTVTKWVLTKNQEKFVTHWRLLPAYIAQLGPGSGENQEILGNQEFFYIWILHNDRRNLNICYCQSCNYRPCSRKIIDSGELTTEIKALFYSMALSAIQWLTMTEICLRPSANLAQYNSSCMHSNH